MYKSVYIHSFYIQYAGILKPSVGQCHLGGGAGNEFKLAQEFVSDVQSWLTCHKPWSGVYLWIKFQYTYVCTIKNSGEKLQRYSCQCGAAVPQQWEQYCCFIASHVGLPIYEPPCSGIYKIWSCTSSRVYKTNTVKDWFFLWCKLIAFFAFLVAHMSCVGTFVILCLNVLDLAGCIVTVNCWCIFVAS